MTIWNPTEYTDDEKLRWCWLRAVEWIRWPCFISQPLVPVLLLFWPWQTVVVSVLACNLLWYILVRPHLVSPQLAQFGAFFVRLKWVVCPVTCLYFYTHGEKGDALLALLWPVLVAVIPSIPGINLLALVVLPTSAIGPVQKRFLVALSYAPKDARYATAKGTEEDETQEDCESRVETTPAAGSVRRATWPSIGMEFVFIPAGEFLMAREDAYNEDQPAHAVQIRKAFWLGKYPVTQGQWERFIEANPSCFNDVRPWEGAARPVEQVSWHDAQRFLRRVNETGLGKFRLPTEAEWEYAARAGSTGDRYGALDEIAWYAGNSGRQTHPVGQKKPNPWGLHDMLGNVLEWCEDRYFVQGDDCEYRVLRGGSWFFIGDAARASFRTFLSADQSHDFVGFRCVWEPNDA